MQSTYFKWKPIMFFSCFTFFIIFIKLITWVWFLFRFSSWDGYLTGKPSLRRTFEYKDWNSDKPIELQFFISEEQIELQINEETLVFDRKLLMGSIGTFKILNYAFCSGCWLTFLRGVVLINTQKNLSFEPSSIWLFKQLW